MSTSYGITIVSEGRTIVSFVRTADGVISRQAFTELAKELLEWLDRSSGLPDDRRATR